MFPGEDRWYFSRQEIENNSPSRADGIDLEEETRLRKYYCSFLKDLASRFNLHQKTVTTAMVFCHRFFLRQSHAKNDKWIIATVCLFIAAKVESTPLNLKTLIVTSNEILYTKVIAAAEQKQEVYERYKELMLSGEKLVLSTLNFDLSVDLPYDILIKAMQKYILDEATQSEFPSIAWKFVQDSFWTTLCLQYQPRHIAAGAFFFAAKHIKMDIQSNAESWCRHFDTTLHQLNDFRLQMGELYRKKKTIPTSTGGSIGETSNSGGVVQQPVPTDNPSSQGASSSAADGSVQDMEGVERDSPDREARDNQEDSRVRDPAAETSGD